MTENQLQLPESVTHITVDGRDIYLVGTAHVSKESVEDVENTIRQVRPDAVAVELCAGRHKSIIQKDAWEKMNIFKVIREKKAMFLLAQLVMTSFYRQLGKKFGVEPGGEMIAGVKLAEETGAKLVLADRAIDITLKRLWGSVGLWTRCKLFVQLLASVLFGEDIDEETIEEMKKRDQLEALMESFGESLPQIKEKLIDERDVYLAQKIRKAEGQKIVAVVGAGHVSGICEHIQQDEPLEPLETLPKKSIWPILLKWGIPILIVALVALSFVRGGVERGTESIVVWVLVNGILSAVGTACAFGHPLAIISAFLAAPLTSLNPAVAAGFVAGIVQAWAKKPTVADFARLQEDLETARGFWTNPAIRVFLVVVMANLGSAIGTWVAIPWIAKLGWA